MRGQTRMASSKVGPIDWLLCGRFGGRHDRLPLRQLVALARRVAAWPRAPQANNGLGDSSRNGRANFITAEPLDKQLSLM